MLYQLSDKWMKQATLASAIGVNGDITGAEIQDLVQVVLMSGSTGSRDRTTVRRKVCAARTAVLLSYLRSAVTEIGVAAVTSIEVGAAATKKIVDSVPGGAGVGDAGGEAAVNPVASDIHLQCRVT